MRVESLYASLAERVQLGDGVVERLLREGARLRGLVLNLEVKHGVVERQTEADRVGRGQAGAPGANTRDFGRLGVGAPPGPPPWSDPPAAETPRGSGSSRPSSYSRTPCSRPTRSPR